MPVHVFLCRALYENSLSGTIPSELGLLIKINEGMCVSALVHQPTLQSPSWQRAQRSFSVWLRAVDGDGQERVLMEAACRSVCR